MVYELGERLKEARKKRKISQTAVAKRIGVVPSTISLYESDNVTPTLDNLTKMALIYNVSIDYLVGINNRNYIIVENTLSERQKMVLQNMVELLKEEFRRQNYK